MSTHPQKVSVTWYVFIYVDDRKRILFKVFMFPGFDPSCFPLENLSSI